jgi:hypothetical protein
MEGTWAWIMAVVAAAVGYLVGSSRSKRVIALAQHSFNIKVDKDKSGNYSSKTTPRSKGVKGRDLGAWKIIAEGSNALPEGAIVFLRFPDGSPLDPAEPDDGRTRMIKAEVKSEQLKKAYPYKVYYKHKDNEHLLEDPELIIEGDRGVIVI